MTDSHTRLCGACRRRLTIETGDVCLPCEQAATEQLRDLPGLRRRLVLAMVPGSGGDRVGRVRSSKPAPLPVRLNPLSLVAAGSLRVPDHLERRVTTTMQTITVMVDGRPYDVTVRHRELAYGPAGQPLYVAAGDQRDPLPIATWLDLWEALVRRHFGDEDPPMPQPYRIRPDQRAYTRAALYGGQLAPGVDPLEAEWLTRFGITAGLDRTDDAADYLCRRLADVCGWMGLDAVELVIELRCLYGAARAAAGEVSDLVYLGRCPETLVDRGTGYEQACGGALVQDPFATVIRCPRCRTETGVRKWMWLARRIRENAAEIEGTAA